MKVGMSDILLGVERITVEKLARSLQREGFSVEIGSDKEAYDIYAEKGNDRRIYEIKIGKNKAQKRVIERLQSLAKEKEAKLFITYLEMPREKEITFDGLEDILLDDLINNIPSELDRLSTHTSIRSIDAVEISVMSVTRGEIKIEGSATVYLSLQYGSDSDMRFGDGLMDSTSSDFYFRVTLQDTQVVKRYYKFDLEHFYGDDNI